MAFSFWHWEAVVVFWEYNDQLAQYYFPSLRFMYARVLCLPV